MAAYQSKINWLIHRYQRQAPSHISIRFVF